MGANAQFDAFEVVLVMDDERLIDPESYQRSYRTRDGRPLAPGHYVVHWAAGTALHGYDERATFHGPYPTRRAAERTESILRLGGDPAADRPDQLPTYTPSRATTLPPLMT
jgi:hypothetical protein